MRRFWKRTLKLKSWWIGWRRKEAPGMGLFKNRRNAILCVCLMAIFGCNNKAKNIRYFTISKIFKTDTLTTVNVHINKRMQSSDLLLIPGKLKTDSAKIQNLAIHYLLPGNTDVSAGDNSYFASARFVKDNEVKPAD